MPKNIVFCADGTWNGLGQGDTQELQADATNVLRLFAALAGTVTPDSIRKQDEQEKVALGSDGQVGQVAKYLHGVGDSQNAIHKLLGGVFGEGFIERIVRGYTFLSRNFAAGDRIYITGFSRGAYTARALGGMVTKMGLLPAASMLAADGSHDSDRAYRLGVYVWARHRRALGRQSTLLGYLEEFKSEKIDLASLVGTFASKRSASGTRSARWACLFMGWPMRARSMSSNSPTVRCRRRWRPASTRWRSTRSATTSNRRCGMPGAGSSSAGSVVAHADVGGGYPTQDLSACSLEWMVGHLQGSGVLISPDWQAIRDFSFGPIHTPYKEPPFDALPHSPRRLPKDALFHPTVQQYLDRFSGYQPEALKTLLSARRLDAKSVRV